MTRIIVDGHCDTISLLTEKKLELISNNLHIDLHRMKKLGNCVQLFAVFVNVNKIKTSPLVYTIKLIDKLYSQVNEYSSMIEIAYTYNDIMRITQSNKICAVISIEGGEALEGDLSVLRMLYRLGVRCIGLTWNHKNQIGCGVLEEIDTGLSGFGIEVVKEMNNLGIIIDVSHLSELSFWHVVNYSTQPIIASHSNARKICSHKRNLNDDQITALAKGGGVIGINFYPPFLNNSGSAAIDDIIKHIDYIAGLVGIECVGLGSDFDGIELVPRGVEEVSKVNNIFNELAKRNYTQQQIDNIAGVNFLRVIQKVLG